MDVVTTSEGQNNPPASGNHVGDCNIGDTADFLNTSGADKFTADSNTDAEESIKENIVGAESTA